MQDDFRSFRRFPAAHKNISDIGPEDIRVSLIGTIVDKSKGKIAVDDGTGSMEAIFDEDILKDFKAGEQVRIVGKISEGLISGEALQNFSKFNLELYKKIKEKN